MSERTISGLISKLQEHNYNDVVLKKNPKTGQVLRRLIYLKVSSTDGQTYKQFASVTKLGPPNMSRGTVDVTDMNSFETNNQMKEYLTDFIEAEEMSIEGYRSEINCKRRFVNG